MSNKADFARTLADTINIGMSECESFGMTWGCKEDCPVYEREECEIQEENDKIFKHPDSEKNNNP